MILYIERLVRLFTILWIRFSHFWIFRRFFSNVLLQIGYATRGFCEMIQLQRQYSRCQLFR